MAIQTTIDIQTVWYIKRKHKANSKHIYNKYINKFIKNLF